MASSTTLTKPNNITKAAKTASINVRVTEDVKSRAEALFNSFGLTLSDAINVFLHKSLMVDGLPFDLKQPKYNKETRAALQEANDITAGKIPAKRYQSVSAMMEDVLKED